MFATDFLLDHRFDSPFSLFPQFSHRFSHSLSSPLSVLAVDSSVNLPPALASPQSSPSLSSFPWISAPISTLNFLLDPCPPTSNPKRLHGEPSGPRLSPTPTALKRTEQLEREATLTLSHASVPPRTGTKRLTPFIPRFLFHRCSRPRTGTLLPCPRVPGDDGTPASAALLLPRHLARQREESPVGHFIRSFRCLLLSLLANG